MIHRADPALARGRFNPSLARGRFIEAAIRESAGRRCTHADPGDARTLENCREVRLLGRMGTLVMQIDGTHQGHDQAVNFARCTGNVKKVFTGIVLSVARHSILPMMTGRGAGSQGR